VIKVGAATEVELKEKKHRIEDAVSGRGRPSRRHRPRRGSALIRRCGARGNLDLTGDEATGGTHRPQGGR